MGIPNIDNEIQKTISEITEHATQQIVELEERLLLSDIIDIYKGYYKDYDEYYKTVVKYNSQCREHNNGIINYDKNFYPHPFIYKPEKRLLLKRNFDYIRALALR